MKRRQIVRREKPQKRQALPRRRPRASVHYMWPDPDKPHVVQLYLSPTRPHMRVAVSHKDGDWAACNRTAGMVRRYYSKVTGRQVVRPGMIIARMFLNVRDLRRNGMEIISHESAHSGMAWAELRKANLAVMPGEEVMAYAVGRIARQVNQICQMTGVWS